MGAGEVDGLTSGEHSEPVDFGYRGVAYHAVLSAEKAEGLERLMSMYIEAGRTVSTRGPRMRVVK